ncbi:MAG: segregation/condensation protein A [Phycisphaerae bacterium]|nr:segregation/condensation protein A [Phycisphaerae bacterium]MDD5380200.1 segregation/condensation protein A [Phycisphaerae bacterium]
MADYRVNLDIFAGPMDLLLYLVRREEVDIYDIPIAEITDQYVRYIEMLQNLDIDLAGDFLVMASTLLQIKSAMLLPKTEIDATVGSEDLADPRAELIRQLLEYKKFKDAANLLSAAADETNKRFVRPGTIIEQLKPGDEPEVDIEQLSIWDLLEAFGSIVEATSGASFDVSHIKDDTPIDLYQIEILHRLQTEGAMSFERIFEGRTRRIVMIGLFLATLELVREKLVGAEQQDSSIYLRPLTEENAEQAVQKAIFTLTEANNEQSVEVKQPEKPPIPISEIPPESRHGASAAEYEKVESADKQQAEN